MEDTSTKTTQAQSSVPSSVPTTEKTGTEHRQALGSAKTENLRDSGWWRIVLPAFIIVCCVALLALPLYILGQLLATTLSANSVINQLHIPLIWLWIAMIVIEVGVAAIIIYGLLRIFLTQAGNYNHGV
jgi:hypothetical protein